MGLLGHMVVLFLFIKESPLSFHLYCCVELFFFFFFFGLHASSILKIYISKISVGVCLQSTKGREISITFDWYITSNNPGETDPQGAIWTGSPYWPFLSVSFYPSPSQLVFFFLMWELGWGGRILRSAEHNIIIVLFELIFLCYKITFLKV